MRVLVTGARGMLGTDVCARLAAEGHEPIATGRSGDVERMDVTDRSAVRRALRSHRPDAVIHCAAYTAVDAAESDDEAAYRLNALGSWTVAAACSEHDVPLCAISTDFVFDGEKVEPYTEFDIPRPLSVYGASKLAGEQCIRAIWRKHWIVRTAWLFGLHGKCFPDTILRAAEARPALRVVADQHGSPTYTADLAMALVALLKTPLYGTYHITNRGATTWHAVAVRAVQLAGLSTPVEAISTEDWSTPARRPRNSVLRPLALEMQNAYNMRPWEEALEEYVRLREVPST